MGHKPEGALFKHEEEMDTGPNRTKPPEPGTPGSTQPDSEKNRDMSFQLRTAPGTPRHGPA
jgi:cytochrome o ubiquinol oxidase subunit 2